MQEPPKPTEQLASLVLGFFAAAYYCIALAVIATSIVGAVGGIIVAGFVGWAITRDTTAAVDAPTPAIAAPYSAAEPETLIARERQPQTVPEGAEILSDTEHSTVYVMPGESVGRVIFK